MRRVLHGVECQKCSVTEEFGNTGQRLKWIKEHCGQDGWFSPGPHDIATWNRIEDDGDID